MKALIALTLILLSLGLQADVDKSLSLSHVHPLVYDDWREGGSTIDLTLGQRREDLYLFFYQGISKKYMVSPGEREAELTDSSFGFSYPLKSSHEKLKPSWQFSSSLPLSLSSRRNGHISTVSNKLKWSYLWNAHWETKYHLGFTYYFSKYKSDKDSNRALNQYQYSTGLTQVYHLNSRWSLYGGMDLRQVYKYNLDPEVPDNHPLRNDRSLMKNFFKIKTGINHQLTSGVRFTGEYFINSELDPNGEADIYLYDRYKSGVLFSIGFDF